ncbi:hypothetical protein ACSBR1_019438 [Camellia fascicularis]
MEDCSICKEVPSTPVKLEHSEKSQVKLEERTRRREGKLEDTKTQPKALSRISFTGIGRSFLPSSSPKAISGMMDSQGGKYFTNLLHEDSNFDDLIFMDSQDQMGQNLKQNTQVPAETTQFSPQMGSTTKRSRGGDFTIDEDNLIVSAWLNTSLDTVYGNEQKHKTYWSRVYEYFHKHKTSNHERDVNSLMHRWSTIQLGTNKFCGCFA